MLWLDALPNTSTVLQQKQKTEYFSETPSYKEKTQLVFLYLKYPNTFSKHSLDNSPGIVLSMSQSLE